MDPMSTQACLIIAEVGSVHDGSLGNAKQLVETAAWCGVDAVKFQTHIAAEETLRDAPTPSYFSGEPRYTYFERTAFTEAQWEELSRHSTACGIEFLSSPFSMVAVELLESLGVTRYKVPSGEVTNLPMIDLIARTCKPVILSSGMSTWEELDQAVNTILRIHDGVTVLQCTSEYPCPYQEVGLNIMLEMRERYKLPVGLSDHTLTPYASLAALTLGASVIERHLTFSRRMYGSDARHSLEPEEFAEFVKGVRAIESMLASPVDKTVMADQLKTMKDTFEKSLVSVVDIPQGTLVTKDMIGVKKPGTGMRPSRLDEIIGRQAVCDIPRDMLLKEGDFDA